jgi:archaemetzincin
MGSEYDPSDLPPKFRVLLPLHQKLPPPGPGDWLAVHPEPGQTYREYVASGPLRADGRRRVLYIQPLGDFRPAQRKILQQTAAFLEIYFGLPVQMQKELPLSMIPAEARRVHPLWGDRQILTTYVLEKVLRPDLPPDAVARIALTTSDLWPGPGWNFVFGQASLQDRVGVWSLYRNGDPEQSNQAYLLCLRRTLKTATHEVAHMFGMLHCIYFQCNMCGSNHRAESDRRPLWLCPVCLAKLVYATGVDPVSRYEKLADWCKQNGLDPEAQFYEKSLRLLRNR